MLHTILSPDRVYRYCLERAWLYGVGTVLFVLLNPSTADENHNDNTIRRGICFAQDWGFQRLLVCELFGIRSRDPRVLLKHPDPVGPENDRYLLQAARESDMTVFAWGNWGKVRYRSAAVSKLFAGRDVKCFGMTQQGEPRHPLYVAKNAALIPFYQLGVPI
jgi:hypothetical protein